MLYFTEARHPLVRKWGLQILHCRPSHGSGILPDPSKFVYRSVEPISPGVLDGGRIEPGCWHVELPNLSSNVCHSRVGLGLFWRGGVGSSCDEALEKLQQGVRLCIGFLARKRPQGCLEQRVEAEGSQRAARPGSSFGPSREEGKVSWPLHWSRARRSWKKRHLFCLPTGQYKV